MKDIRKAKALSRIIFGIVLCTASVARADGLGVKLSYFRPDAL